VFYSHASFARFIEWAFNLPTLGAADDLSTYTAGEPKPGNLRDFFGFSGSPPKGKRHPAGARLSQADTRATDAGGHRTRRLNLRTLRVVQEMTVYEAAGGMPFFEALVDRFYEGVAADPDLLALYPEPEDLSGARHRLTLFLAQYWGGPDTYSQERGHPRLRMRHATFAVGPDARDRWLRHFRDGLDAAKLSPEHDAQFWAYAQHAANFMVNSAG